MRNFIALALLCLSFAGLVWVDSATSTSEGVLGSPIPVCVDLSNCSVEEITGVRSEVRDKDIPASLDLEQLYPAKAATIRMVREAGFSDQMIQQAIEKEWRSYRDLGFSDAQVNEMFNGQRPFPPVVSPSLTRYPALLKRALAERQALIESPVPYRASESIEPSTLEEEKERREMIKDLLMEQQSRQAKSLQQKLQESQREIDALRNERDRLRAERDQARKEREQAEQDAAYWFFNRKK